MFIKRTAITFEESKDDSMQDKIFENIRLHKEVLQSVKFEPWSMKRKLRLVKQVGQLMMCNDINTNYH